ncbi:hypothetical protein OK016_25725 [Vibrio chagasii]|nr:hypothetical protein [Vibrio chagasii]
MRLAVTRSRSHSYSGADKGALSTMARCLWIFYEPTLLRMPAKEHAIDFSTFFLRYWKKLKVKKYA